MIIDAVVFGMIDVGGCAGSTRHAVRLLGRGRSDRRRALAAVLAGVAIGIVLSLGWLIYVSTRPPMPLLGRERGTQVFRELDENPGDETFPGVVVLRLDSGLFFATSQALEDRVRALTQDGSSPRMRWSSTSRGSTSSTRRAQSSSRRSSSSSRAAADATARARQANVLAVLRADGFVDRLDADRIHGNVDRAVDAQLSAPR